MALIRVAQYSSTPTLVTDYQAQNAHLQAFTNQLLTQQFILDAGTAQPIIKQGCYVSHGGSLYIADADTSITGSPGDGSVYIRVSGTTSLTVEFVINISGYTWNPVYTALTSGSYTLLPYLIVKSSTVWTRYNFNPNNQQFDNARIGALAVTGNATVGGTLGVSGAISGATVNTGQGANEVYAMNQNVRTTDAVTFATVNTGQGATEVHLMNQNLRTIDNVYFVNINPPIDNEDSSLPSIGKGGFTYGTVVTSGTISLPTGGAYITIGVTTAGTINPDFCGRFTGGTALSNASNDTMIYVWRIA